MTVRPQARPDGGRSVFWVGWSDLLQSWAQPPRLPERSKPEPDLANIRYGPHDRNVLDL